MDTVKRGIILMNLGSPDSTEVKDVKKYLDEFLMDEKVIDKSWLFRALLVKGIIVPFRAPKSAKAYKTIDELKEWYVMQANNPVLRKIKSQLNELADEKTSVNSKEKIHKTVSFLAIQLRKENNKGCQYIHALNNYLHLDYEANA